METGRRKSLVMVPAWRGQPSRGELERLSAAGIRPRTDYVELANALGADVMDMEYLRVRASPLARLVARGVGTVPAEVLDAFVRRNDYRAIVARADRLALPLALLFKLARSRRDLVLISAWLSSPKKAMFLRPLNVDSHLKAIVNYSSVQLTIAAERLAVPREKLHHARQPVDERFWRPQGGDAEDNVLCAVGLEARDYRTLLEAVRGLRAPVEIAVGTTVFRKGDVTRDLAPTVRPLTAGGLPSNVQLRQQLDHVALRALYARSRCVVVPLYDVDSDCGVTVIAEAMAMGKAVVVSRARGQVDLVRHGEHGIYVRPADPRDLRAALESLLARPADAERMGRAGRALVENELTLDRWVAQVAAVALADSEADVKAVAGSGRS
jgi:glycosyltransferase involved in cell wall biosynthesis